jgi:hypothetical protein
MRDRGAVDLRFQHEAVHVSIVFEPAMRQGRGGSAITFQL